MSLLDSALDELLPGRWSRTGVGDVPSTAHGALLLRAAARTAAAKDV
jgi:hypothetical protein